MGNPLFLFSLPQLLKNFMSLVVEMPKVSEQGVSLWQEVRAWRIFYSFPPPPPPPHSSYILVAWLQSRNVMGSMWQSGEDNTLNYCPIYPEGWHLGKYWKGCGGKEAQKSSSKKLCISSSADTWVSYM